MSAHRSTIRALSNDMSRDCNSLEWCRACAWHIQRKNCITKGHLKHKRREWGVHRSTNNGLSKAELKNWHTEMPRIWSSRTAWSTPPLSIGHKVYFLYKPHAQRKNTAHTSAYNCVRLFCVNGDSIYTVLLHITIIIPNIVVVLVLVVIVVFFLCFYYYLPPSSSVALG